MQRLYASCKLPHGLIPVVVRTALFLQLLRLFSCAVQHTFKAPATLIWLTPNKTMTANNNFFIYTPNFT